MRVGGGGGRRPVAAGVVLDRRAEPVERGVVGGGQVQGRHGARREFGEQERHDLPVAPVRGVLDGQPGGFVDELAQQR